MIFFTQNASRPISTIQKDPESDLFISIRDAVRMLAAHCKKNHPSMSNHGCKLMLATGTRLLAYDLPKVLVNELNYVQLEIYKQNMKKSFTIR